MKTKPTYDHDTGEWCIVIDEYGTTLESDDLSKLEEALDAIENWKRLQAQWRIEKGATV